jgi:pimeloyl-ACP methyl ester carboxylesterase
MPVMSVDLVARPDPRDDFWSRCGRGFAAGGRAVGRAAVRVGRGVSSAYAAVDPDLRRHVAQLPLMGLTLLSSRNESIEAIADDGHRPIVFVHGLAGHPGNFLAMRKFLAMSGRKRTYAVALPSVETMQAGADHLSRFIEEVLRVNGLPPGATVDCVGHSMGGLVARLAFRDPATTARVSTLVTLGTPHLGTYAARFGATQNVLDLRPGSTAMTELDLQLPWRGPPHQPRLVALWSPADVLLLPAEAARAPGAHAVEMRGFTHYSYLLNPLAWSRVLSLLEPEQSRMLAPDARTEP